MHKVADLDRIDGFDPVPVRAGIGLKPQHYHAVLEEEPAVGWFEVHAENYMGAGGPPHRFLEAIRERYPLSLHGVGLSLGSAEPLDEDHLQRLFEVQRRYRPGLVSEHLAWSAFGGAFTNDLLPLPLTGEALGLMADHVDRMQEVLGRRVLIENPSTYVRAVGETMSEPEFLGALVARTGCALLVDINNVYVSAENHGFSAEDWLDAIDGSAVGEIHLAGHAVRRVGRKTLRIDDHGSAVPDPVWALYRRFVRQKGPAPTLIEWDTDVPALEVLLGEAAKADAILADAIGLGPVLGEAYAEPC